MKKIGYVIPNFPTLSETFVGNEMRAMMALGHQVKPYAFSASNTYQPADAYLKQQCSYLSEAPRYPLRNLWRAYRSHGFVVQQQGLGYLSLLRQGLQLAYLVERDGCEHLHAHFAWHSTATAITAAKLLNIPVSFVGHGADIYSAPQDLSCKLQASDFVCAVTQEMQKELQLATDRPVLHIPCGIHSPDYPQLEKHWQPDKDFLFIGRLVEKKGIDTLLLALRHLRCEASLDIVGDGPLRAKLKQLVSELQLNHRVTFHGSKDASWYRHHARRYKALVVPFTVASNGDKDTGPLVIKEAMALGLPVITSDLAGCSEILNTQSGLQVPMDDPVSLSKAMHHQLSTPADKIHQQRLHAFKRVMQMFTTDRQARLLSEQVEAR